MNRNTVLWHYPAARDRDTALGATIGTNAPRRVRAIARKTPKHEPRADEHHGRDTQHP
jgi:hypothetical protein